MDRGQGAHTVNNTVRETLAPVQAVRTFNVSFDDQQIPSAPQLFREAIEAAGLTAPDEIIADGTLHRFASNGGRSDTAGWYVFHSDGLPAGSFGCFRSNLTKKWCGKPENAFTQQERLEYRKRIEAMQRQREAEERQRHAEAAQRAQRLWDVATPAPVDHSYLLKKQIPPEGLRVDSQNRLLIPVLIDGTFSSLQFIDADGEKHFLSGGKVSGGSFTLGDFTAVTTLLLCEGVATGTSLYTATGFPVVCAFSASNLLPVAKRFRQLCPTVVMLVCGDNDIRDGKPNAGRDMAAAAAKAIHGLLVLPELNGEKCDFNDLGRAKGLTAVKEVIEKALHQQQDNPVIPTDSNGQGHYIPPDTAAQLHTPPALAQDPNILARFEEAVRLCGVVGEERCAKLVYLALTSRLLHEPVSLVIKGVSSSGKSHTTMITVKFFPDTAAIAMTAMSSKALVYMKEEFSHRTLVLYEATALRESREKDDGDMTSYFIRSLLSEGRIVYSVTVRDKHERFVTRTIVKEGPMNCIVTTTSLSLHGENETRMLSIPTNDTQAQTKAVMLRVAQGASQQAPDLRDWHALQLWLEQAEHRVVIPYATALAEGIPPIAVRLRRDIKSLFRLIDAHAMLHQCSRVRDEQGRIVATMDDYQTVRALVVDLMANGVGATVPETIRSTVQVVQQADQETGMTVREVARKLQLDRSAAQRRLQGAREKGYVMNLEEKRGRPARYALGEPLPDEVELLPVALPGYDRCAHTPSLGGTALHSASHSHLTTIVEPVQVCACAGEKKSDELPVPSNLDDEWLVINATSEVST
jgi:phage/plasmid primase-like uncharacterized protein